MSAATVRAFRRHCEDQFQITAQSVPPHDPAELSAYVEGLSQFYGMTLEEIRAVDDTPLPRGFIHVRMHDAIDGEETRLMLGSRQPCTTRNVAEMAVPYLAPRKNVERWIGTTIMPITTPGVLDLMIHYRDKPEGWQEREHAALFGPLLERLRAETHKPIGEAGLS